MGMREKGVAEGEGRGRKRRVGERGGEVMYLHRPGLGFWLCGFGQATQHLWALFLLSTKRG